MTSFDEFARAEMTRREVLAAGAVIAAFGSIPSIGSNGASATDDHSDSKVGDNHILWYPAPAEQWVEALPIGNGRLGAMIYGGTTTERIQLNEGTLWAGSPHDYTNPNALLCLAELRRLVFKGDVREAQDLANANFMSQPIGQMPYQTLGEFIIQFELSEGNTTEYRRELDIDSSIHRVSFLHNGVRYTREAFASHPDQLIIVRLTADRPHSISCRAKLASPHQGSSMDSAPGRMSIQGISGDVDGLKGRVQFCAIARIIVDGRDLNPTGEEMVVTSASEVEIFLSMATSYIDYEDISGDAMASASSHLNRKLNLASLKERHIQDYQKLFRRVTLDLGKSPHRSEPTEERLRQFQIGSDLPLVALYFQYGRYLLISCSRPGGQAATLQGLWNDSLTPPWGSKYTTNINTEMNYWPAETCGLSECHEPLFNLISEIAKTGKHTAQIHYGAKGWVLHHNTDGWRGTAPIDGAGWGIWPTGGAWLCTHLWEHYLFGRDKSILARHYPLMKGAAEFFVDTLVVHPTKGWMVTCPSTSPENSHHDGQGLCAGPTMDMQIIRDLFDACIEASTVLDRDHDFRDQIKLLRGRLAPMQVGHAGQLQEWLEDWDVQAPEPHHRHVSHLYGLFPSNQISRKATPELFAAARKSLELRGDEGTGWSLAWKINLWARLGDGDRASSLVRDALRPVHAMGTHYGEGGGVYPNLFDAHPPFQIDGNFGFSSGIAEMLLQSQEGNIHLLPALPAAWAQGEVRGLRARGGYILNIRWSNGVLQEAQILGRENEVIVVRYADSERSISLEGGRWTKLSQHL